MKTEPNKEQQKQVKKIPVPRQKTFRFSKGTSTHEIDVVVNAWLEEKASRGVLPTVGKVSVGVFKIVYVYLYLEQIEG